MNRWSCPSRWSAISSRATASALAIAAADLNSVGVVGWPVGMFRKPLSVQPAFKVANPNVKIANTVSDPPKLASGVEDRGCDEDTAGVTDDFK